MATEKFSRWDILLIDNDKSTAELLEKYLNQHRFKVTILTSGEFLETVLVQRTVDAILLDILLPGQNGLYWLDWLVCNYPNIPVLLCSQCNSAEERATGLGRVSAYKF